MKHFVLRLLPITAFSCSIAQPAITSFSTLSATIGTTASKKTFTNQDLVNNTGYVYYLRVV